ncbi:MAG: hypothetical protein II295_01715 [Akkermansia sp.]|jgi:hypothetical protein|nr:hypothetical protein [Akkermansia sp.]
MKIFTSILSVVAAAVLACSCQQQRTYPVFFLVQDANTVTDAAESSSARQIIRYKGVTYTRIPILSLDHFESFESHINPNDGSYGVTLYAKKEWRNRLYFNTLDKSGMLMLPVVNGLAMEPMRIAPVNDGALVIWNGLNGYDLRMIGRTLKPRNPELEKKRYKKENPRPLPKAPKDVKQQTRDFTGRTVGELFN